MSCRIVDVKPKSPAYKAGVRSGDVLVSINNHNINDVLDYKFYSYDSEILLTLEGRETKLVKSEGEDLGLGFENYLMDKAKSCSNNCVFCFIDQLPQGMRDTLYFKDDDARMSFLMGNYITLTNLSESDIERIIKMRLSPINISVHATDPEIRLRMLRNKRAGECFDILKRFAEKGIELNCQIVVCPGINDGEVLNKTLSDLIGLAPSVKSISVVPVGLTRFREGLFPLKGVDAALANETIEAVDSFGRECIERFGSRTVYAADELFIKANRDIPECEYYEDYPQLENGVGMIRLLSDEFLLALEGLSRDVKIKSFTIATGVSAATYISKLVDELRKKCDNTFKGNIIPIENKFFGNTVNVTGLITGRDLTDGLKDKRINERVLISKSMLRYGDTAFLDDVTVSDIETALGVEVLSVSNNGEELLNTLISGRIQER